MNSKFYYPQAVFAQSKAARACVEKLHRTSKMGNIMNVVLDTCGMFTLLIFELKIVYFQNLIYDFYFMKWYIVFLKKNTTIQDSHRSGKVHPY